MKLSLLLVLALLGAVSAHPLSERALEQEISGELGSSVLEKGSGDMEPPGIREGKNIMVRVKSSHFRVVLQSKTFHEAERECKQRFRGHLASVHSHSGNECVWKAAHSCTKQAQVWIGGVTQSSGGRTVSRWEDNTPWNYCDWAGGNPNRSGTTCVALCTAGGHWRSANCKTHLPFICQY